MIWDKTKINSGKQNINTGVGGTMFNQRNLNLVFSAAIFSFVTVSCRTTPTRVKRAVSTATISGVVAPGKGFDLRSRELTENICVISQDGNSGSSGDSSDSDSASSNNSGETSSESSIYLNEPTGESNSTSRASFRFDLDPPASAAAARGKLNLAGEQSGGSQIDLFYAHTLRDLLVSLDATIQFEMGGSRGGGDLQNVDSEFLPTQQQPTSSFNLTEGEGTESSGAPSADSMSGSILGKFRAQLQVQFKNSVNKSFILLHGVKTFPTLDADTVRNPKFNPMFSSAIFSGKVPEGDQLAATTYNEFRKYCGDYYVESVVRGREVWLVAVMESSQFNSLYQASGDVVQGSHVKANDVGELKNNMKAHVNAQNSNSFLSQKVEIKVASRGKINMNLGNFTFEDALDKFNMFLNSVDATSTGLEEGALSVALRSYDNVRYSVGANEVRLGNIFTTAVKNRSAKDINVLSKLVQEAAWADKEYKLLNTKYRWGQWSLDDAIYNGVANQAQGVFNYRKTILEVLQYCGQISDEKNASEECMAKAQAVATVARPVLKLPKPYDNNVEFWFPEALISAVRAGKKTDSLVLNQDAARAACKKLVGGNWVLPNASDWKRMVEASFFYSKWNARIPGYRAASDSDALSLPCGSLNSITFWSDDPGRAVQISPQCAQDAVSLIGPPKSFEYTRWFGFATTELKGAYGCVRYRPMGG